MVTRNPQMHMEETVSRNIIWTVLALVVLAILAYAVYAVYYPQSNYAVPAASTTSNSSTTTNSPATQY